MMWRNLNPDLFQVFLSLLTKFELIFPLPSNRYLIPNLLEDSPPPSLVSNWIRETKSYVSSWRQYCPPFATVGLFARLMCRLNIRFTNCKLIMWKDLILIRKVSSKDATVILPTSADLEAIKTSFDSYVLEEALVRFDANSFQLDILARGQLEHFTLFADIIDTIDTLLENIYVQELQDGLIKYCFCPFCVNFLSRSEIPDFTTAKIAMEKCVDEIAEGRAFIECDSKHRLRLDILVPDLMLIGIPILTHQRLQNLKEIGKGGFGIVYKGVLDGSVTVAVKRMRDFDDDFKEKMLQEFQKEAKIMNSLEHPNLVKLLGVTLYPNQLVNI